MKNKSKKNYRSFIVVLILFVFISTILLNNNLRSLIFEIIFPYFKKFMENKSWTIPTLVAIIFGVIGILNNKRTNKQNKTLPHLSQPAIQILKKSNDLEKIVNLRPFIENQANSTSTGRTKSWKNLKAELNFSEFESLDLTSNHNIYFITGKYGIGKSTYMLKVIEENLQNKKSGFNKVIFLNPSCCELWSEELKDVDSKKTLLVLDALSRVSETNEEFIERCNYLFQLAFNNTIGDDKTSVGPFKILVTIRSDEFRIALLNKLIKWPDTYFKYETKHSDSNLKQIISKYIESYKIKINIAGDKEDSVISQIIIKSEGMPFYLRHFFLFLKNNNLEFSEENVKQCPTGVVNLIWQTIEKTFNIPNDVTIPFLLLLYTKFNNSYSSYFNLFLVENISLVQPNVKNRVKNLSVYFDNFERKINKQNYVFHHLNSHWETSILSVLENKEIIDEKYASILEDYVEIHDSKFQTLYEKIFFELQNKLQDGFKNIEDVFLCIDLANLSQQISRGIFEENLCAATDIYLRLHSLSPLPIEYINFVRDELYILWINKAWKYRTLNEIDSAITCYEYAFDKLSLRIDKKQLSAYAYFIKKFKLPYLKYETTEYNDCVKKTELLYKEVIKLDEKDKVSWQTFALFNKDIGRYEDAEKCFEQALTLDSDHIPTIQAFALFYIEKAKLEWVNDRNRALEYYKKAEDKFLKARSIFISILESKNKNISLEEYNEIEKRLLNAYSRFLVDKTEWCNSKEERIKIDEEIDDILDNLSKKYPNHGQTINTYANFLLGYAKILPKYKRGENNIKAEGILNNYIKKNKDQNELSYFMALHVLANYYFVYKPVFDKKTIDFNMIENLLIDSAKSYYPKHNSIAFNSLGKFYVRWASSLRHNPIEYNQKMDKAKAAYENAMNLPINNETALHLSKIYFNYAFYLKYVKKDPTEYVTKALEIARKFTYIPFTFYYNLTNLGDEMISDGDIDLAMTIFMEANKIGISHSIDCSYSFWRLGDIYKQKNELVNAIKMYKQSAESQNTIEGYSGRRNSIKQLINGNVNELRSNSDLYKECVETKKNFSEKTYQLNKTWKSCRDFGEDLLDLEKVDEAMKLFKEGISIVSESKDLNKDDIGKALSMFHLYLGLCYKKVGDIENAENSFEKIVLVLDTAYSNLKTSIQLSEIGKYEKAINYFNKFVISFPSASENQKEKTYFEISSGFQKHAENLEKTNKISESVIYWKNYADLSYYSNSQISAKVYGITGNNLLRKKMYHDARENLIKSLRLNQSNEEKAKNLSQLGGISLKLSIWEEAYICFEKSFIIRSDNRDKDNRDYCFTKIYNKPNSETIEIDIDFILRSAIIFELKGDLSSALEEYKKALIVLNQTAEDSSEISKLKFIADAFYMLGDKNSSVELYKNKINKICTGIDRIAVETILWFIRDADLQKDEQMGVMM